MSAAAPPTNSHLVSAAHFHSTALIATLLCNLLSGCGGGGTSNPAPSPPPAPPNEAPVAEFIVSLPDQFAPVTAGFDGTASRDPDGSITAFAWEFGDGATGNGAQTSHTYTDPGTFTVQLTVTDNSGATARSSQTVQISEPVVGTVVLRGEIQILASSAIDTDVNDVLSLPNQPNNTAGTAQLLPVPVSLGGFANLPGSGPTSGRLFSSGDSSDFFAINGAGGEGIGLDVGGHPDSDLDLRLWNANMELVDASVGFNATESLQLAAAGDYFIEVVAVSGASTYVLNVGLLTAATRRTATRLSDNFVPGQLLVHSRAASPQENAASNHAASRLLARSGEVELRELADRTEALQQINQQLPGTAPVASPSTTYAINGSGLSPNKNVPNPSLTESQALRYATLQHIAGLRQAGARAEANLLRHAHQIPDDTLYGAQWHYDAVSLPLAWDITTGSSEVVIAVVDTGVLVDHPDFAGKLIPGFDFISSASRGGDGDGIDANPDDPGDASFAGTSSFHGTHVAGVAGALTNNATGVAGSGWNTRIMPLRVLGREGGTSFDILQAIRYAAGLDNSTGTVPARRADIINLSLGGGLFSQSEQDLFNEVRAANVLVFASAGNESSGAPSYPAAYNGVFSVSATTINNTLASYSNFGNSIDLAAPGGDSGTDINGDGIGDGVMSTLGDDGTGGISFGYGVLSGTSMAAPHAAGVAALMKALHPTLTPDEFAIALAAGELTQDIGPPGKDDQFGFGLLNAQRAVLAASALASGTAADPGPILSSTANRLNFGAFQTEFAVTLTNAGTQQLQIAETTSNQPWLSATANSTDANGLGTYLLTVDRRTLQNGTYQGTVTFTSNSNPQSVQVLMQVSSIDLDANAGTHFIILVDGNGNTAGQTFVNTPVDGFYAFSLTGVTPGDYRLFAGTDLDNDDFLCDSGEACGAFRTLDSPETISISSSRTDLNFLSGFRQNFGVNQQAHSSSAQPQTNLPVANPPVAIQEAGRINSSQIKSWRINKQAITPEEFAVE